MTHGYQVGDILSSSWGYSMTIVDYYIVERVTPSTVTISMLAGKEYIPGEQSGYAGYCKPQLPPVLSDYADHRHMVRRVSKCGTVRGQNRSAYCRKWDGKPSYYNHND